MKVARCILLLSQLFLHLLSTYINLPDLLSLNQFFPCFLQLVPSILSLLVPVYKYLSILSEYLPSHSCSCCHCNLTLSTGISPITKITKSFTVSTSSHITSCFTSPTLFVALSHLLQTKNFAELGVTFFNFKHLPRIHKSHCTEFTVTLLSHILHGSIPLCIASPSDLHTITFVFSRFIFNPLLSNALLHFRNFYFGFFVISFISAKSSADKPSFTKPFTAFSVTTSTTIATTKMTKQISDVHQPLHEILLRI